MNQEDYLCIFESPTGKSQGFIKRQSQDEDCYIVEDLNHKIHKVPRVVVTQTRVTKERLNKYLDIWWEIDPRQYHQLHEKHHGVGLFMWDDLYSIDPNLSEAIMTMYMRKYNRYEDTETSEDRQLRKERAEWNKKYLQKWIDSI